MENYNCYRIRSAIIGLKIYAKHVINRFKYLVYLSIY